MRSLVFITITSLLISVNISNAQVFTRINSSLLFTTDNNVYSDYGIGGEILIGYSVNQKTDFSIGAGNLWFRSMLGYRIKFAKVNVKYYFPKNDIKPFLGLGTGMYIESFDGPFEGRLKFKPVIGVQPSAGILFRIRKTEGFYLNTEFSYLKIFTENNLNLINFNLGISYYF